MTDSNRLCLRLRNLEAEYSIHQGYSYFLSYLLITSPFHSSEYCCLDYLPSKYNIDYQYRYGNHCGGSRYLAILHSETFLEHRKS